MLNDFNMRSKKQNAEHISDLIAQLDAEDTKGYGLPDASSLSMDDDEEHNEEWVRRQKAQIKELQVKIEGAKKDFKRSRAELEAVRLKEPALYLKKSTALDKVKMQLE